MESRRRRSVLIVPAVLRTALILLITAAIFAVDLMTPHLLSVWALYVLPLVVSSSASRSRNGFRFAALFTFLILVGLATPESSSVFSIELANRSIGIAILWALALAMAARNKAEEGMATAVAARGEAEARLLVSEENFQSVVDQIAQYAIIMLDSAGHVVTWNIGAERITGYVAADILGQSINRFYLPADLASGKPARILDRARLDGRCEDEGWRLRKDGSRFWADVVVSAIRNEAGALTGFVAVSRDLSRKSAEDRLRLTVESAPSGMVLVDHGGTIVLVNRQIEEQFGYSGEEMVGHRIEMLLPPAFRDTHPADRARYAAAPTVRPMGLDRELYGQRKDGREFPVEIGLNPIETPDGSLILCSVVDITERRRAEQALRESEARYRAIVENALDAVITMDDQGLLVGWNSQAERIFGWSADEVMRKPLADIIIPKRLREAHNRGLKHYLATGEGPVLDKRIEITALHRNGHEFPAELAIGLLHQAGHVLFSAFLRDITERKRVEQSRQATEARLLGVVESAMDAIISVDHEQRIVLFNAAAEQMFRCAASEVLGQSIERFIPERYRSDHRHDIERFGESGTTTRRMGALRNVFGTRADGEEFPAEAAISQIHTAQGKLFTVILRDITQRKQAEQTLQHERNFISAVLETQAALVVILDREGRILKFNRACARATGYSFEEVQGKPFWELFLVPEEAETVKEVFRELRDVGLPNQHENYWLTKSGERRRISWANSTMMSPSREVDYIMGWSREVEYIISTGIDVTDLKETQDRLRQTERLAELGTLASGMAHEIGTPMNVILGRAEHLLQRTDDERTRKGLEIIIGQVERITRIMNQLLTFARRRPMDRRPIDLRRTIVDTLDVLYERIQKNGIAVDTVFPETLPPAVADPDQISQVLLNLLVNAIHAMPDGGTLRLTLSRRDRHLALAVADTGHGIPKDVLPKVFNPFFTTKEVGKGTGLGLTVVHGIITEHGGTIEVESEPGRGTTFTLTLPIEEVPIDEESGLDTTQA
jgi:PAS domain S-box-containing protein